MTSAAVRGRGSRPKPETAPDPLRKAPANPLITSNVATARYFKVLSDPTRLAILRLLLEREHSVAELVELLQVPQSRVSNHLACLRWCRFVESETSRRGVYRAADPEQLREVLAVAENASRGNCDHLSSCSRIGPDWV